MMSKKANKWVRLAGLCMILLFGDAFGAEGPGAAKPTLWQRTKSYASGVKQRVSSRLGTIKALATGNYITRFGRIQELSKVKLQLEAEKKSAAECNKGGIQRTINTLQRDIQALQDNKNEFVLASLLVSTAQSLVTSKEVLAATAAGVCYYYRAPLATGVGATTEGVKKAVKTYTPEPVKKTVSKYVVRPANKYVVKPVQKNIVRPVARKYKQVTGKISQIKNASKVESIKPITNDVITSANEYLRTRFSTDVSDDQLKLLAESTKEVFNQQFGILIEDSDEIQKAILNFMKDRYSLSMGLYLVIRRIAKYSIITERDDISHQLFDVVLKRAIEKGLKF